MKKLLSILVVMFFIMTNGISQTITEGFEGTFPPEGWTITGDWEVATNQPYEGTKSLYTYWGDDGGRIVLPAYMAGGQTYLNFFLRMDYPSDASLTIVTVQVADATQEELEWTIVQTIAATTDYDWALREVNLTQYVDQEILVSINVEQLGMGTSVYIDNILLFENTCPKPTNLTAVSVAMTSAGLTWVDENNSGNYDLQVVPFDADWSSAEVINVSGDVTYELTDLLPGTTYKARVKSVCSEGESLYSDVITFNTTCSETLTSPFEEEFNSLNCWTIVQNATDPYWGETFPEIAENTMTGNGYLLQTSFDDVIIAVTAPIAIDFENTQMVFEALAYYDYNPATIEVGYLTNLTDASTFVPMNTFAIETGSAFGEYIAPLAGWELEEGSDYYLAIKIGPDSEYDAVYLNNFKITEIPPCPAPIRTSVTVVPNADNAVVSWVDNMEDHEAWIVYYKQESEEEWLSVEVSEQTITLTELTPETTYQVYVMTDCGIENNTEQTYTVSFTTTSLPVEMPYFQDFEDTSAVSEFIYYSYDDINTWAIGNATAYSEEGSEEATGNSMYISNDNGVTNAYTHNYDYSIAAFLVYFEPGAEYTLSFDYKVDGEEWYDYLRVYALDPFEDLENYWNGQTLSEELHGQAEWAHFESVIPSSWIGTTKQILFYWHNNSSDGNQPPAAIDNISISQTTCVRPTNVEVTEVTANTATISWEGQADSYNFGYRILGSESDYIVEITSENNITITDLMPASAYEFVLQSVCGEEVSPMTDEAQFFTSCQAIEGVWYEDFESVLQNEDAAELKFSCWSVLEHGLQTYNGVFPRIYWEGYEPSAHSGEVTLEFKGNGFLLLPEFATDLSELQLTFFANTTASTVEDAGTFDVGYVTDPTDTSTFVLVQTVTPVGLSRSESVMVGPFLFTDAEEGRIALRYRAIESSSPESWNLDDFKVEPVPECPSPNPYSVTISNITESEATISWVDEDESHSLWTVFYKAENEEEYTEQQATEQTITLTGLQASTQYTVYVQTDCGTEDNLSQTIPVTFGTTAIPISDFPYFQNFEDITNEPFNVEYTAMGVNRWAVGTAAGSAPTEESEETDTYSMYISNNNGQTFNYDQHQTSYSYAVVPIAFGDALEYAISFDYKVVGEIGYYSYDYLTVVLTETDYQIPADGQLTENAGTVILNKAGNTADWTHFVYSSSQLSNTNKKLIFYWTNDTGATNGIPAAIDNFSITTSNCPSPAEFTCTSTNSTEANFAWAESEMTSWILYYKANDETTYTSVEVVENPFTLTELNPATQYTAYLVSNCAGEESSQTPIVNFTTECSTVEDFPYSYGFETEEFLCWTNAIVTGEQEWYITESISAEGSKYAKFVATGYNQPSARLISPIFDLSSLTNPYIKYSHISKPWASDIDELKVQYRTSPNEEWVDLIHYTAAFNDWTSDSLVLPNPSATYQIAFLGTSNYGYGVGVDAIEVYDADGEGGGGTDPEPEPCDAPTNLTVNNITANSADVTWNGTAETYELKLNGGEAETLTTTSKQLIGLPENFTITVEVRSICGNQQSEWVSTTFTTLDGEDPEPEPCDAPTNLSASNITKTSAEITWNGTATTYEFKLSGGEAETLTTTTKALTGLTPNTAYTVEVRAICEDQQSAWVTTNFTTLEEQVVIVLGEVTTSPATEVGNTSATLNGALVSAGNAENFTVGFALATVADFTLEDAEVQNITATLAEGTFSQAVNDLVEGQTYFYRAYITNEAGTAYGAVETFTLSSLTDAIAGTITATIYPNPATDNATMEIVGLDQDAKIVISDLQGRILSQEAINAGETHYTINVSNMASGVYYIRIVTDKAVSTQKLIVE